MRTASGPVGSLFKKTHRLTIRRVQTTATPAMRNRLLGTLFPVRESLSFACRINASLPALRDSDLRWGTGKWVLPTTSFGERDHITE